MYESRKHDKIGTNGFGPLKQNWTAVLGYWMSSSKMLALAREVSANGGKRIENQEIINSIAGWGITDEKGNILIPVIYRNNNDHIDCLCRAITANLSNAVKNHCVWWSKAHNIVSQQLGQVIFLTYGSKRVLKRLKNHKTLRYRSKRVPIVWLFN